MTVRLLYRNSRSIRVRALQYGMWAAALAFALASLALPWIWPEGDALALAILAPILAAFALGMEVYRGLYVTELVAVPGGVEVETFAFLGRRRHLLPWPAISPDAARTRSYFARGAVSTAILLRRPDARLPYVIDTTEDAFDTAALRRLRPR